MTAKWRVPAAAAAGALVPVWASVIDGDMNAIRKTRNSTNIERRIGFLEKRNQRLLGLVDGAVCEFVSASTCSRTLRPSSPLRMLNRTGLLN